MNTLVTDSTSLNPFFHPNGVAVIGASRDSGKLSYGVLLNLLDKEQGFPGPVYPINPKADEILGRTCYPHISAAPDPLDLAVLILPAGMIAESLEDCGKRGVKAAVIISGGFREIGREGEERERRILEIARAYHMRLMGPNGIGVIDTNTPLNTTFILGTPPRGDIAFLSQSGALCGGVIDWVIGRGIGFSRMLSVGNEADVTETDALLNLAEDPNTKVITTYLEDIKNGPGFLYALQTIAPRKPIVIIKTGRTASGQAATASHTGAMAGTHAAFRAACKQFGAIEAAGVEAMFNGALALSYQPLPKGRRVALLTNAGGPAAVAADAMETYGLLLAKTSPRIQTELKAFLLPDAQTAGPVDMLGGASTEEYKTALSVLLRDPDIDGVLVILVPQALNHPADVVDALAEVMKTQNEKPVLACFMGETSVGEAFQKGHAVKLPMYRFPEAAVESFGMLWRRAQWLQKHNAEPEALPSALPSTLIAAAQSSGETALDSETSLAILQTIGVAIPASVIAHSAEEAAQAAEEIGFPIAMKLMSPDVLHKSDIGAVIINVRSADAARQAFDEIMERTRRAVPNAKITGVQAQRMIGGGIEVILGVKRDPTLGPLIMFGLGGVYAEALADVSFRLAPLTQADAEEMIGEVRSAKLLGGLRGAAPSDISALTNAILALSSFAAANPQIQEMDINPLIVLPEGQGAIAADARILLA